MAAPYGFHGQNTSVTGSAAALAASTLVKTGVCIKALPGNSQVVYVGLSNSVTSSTGFPLSAGESMSFDVSWFRAAETATGGLAASGDLANVYVIAASGTQGLAYWGV